MQPLTDEQTWGSDELAQVKEPDCPLAAAAGGCPADCTFCDDWLAAGMKPSIEETDGTEKLHKSDAGQPVDRGD